MFFEPDSLEEAVSRLAGIPCQDDEALLVMVAERDAPDLEGLVDGLRDRRIRFFGALFPAITDGTGKRDAGIAALPLRLLGEPSTIRSLGDASLPNTVREAAERGRPGIKPTAVVFVDGLSAGITPFLRRAYDELGNSVAYLGGGAGSLSLEQRPCVFSAEGVFEDAAVVAISPQPCGLGVRHGWLPIAGPLVATRTEGNRIHEINWEPALPVYTDIVERDSRRPFHRDHFFELAKAYPFGLFRDEQETVVRDPIRIDDDGALVCVGWVPENSVLHIMKGAPDGLINAAADAARDATRTSDGRPAHTVVIDCISRAIFLGERFADEMRAIREALDENGAPAPIGALTLGEVSCRGDGILEFYNKTAVVGVLHES